jgi:hypothetical protein
MGASAHEATVGGATEFDEDRQSREVRARRFEHADALEVSSSNYVIAIGAAHLAGGRELVG